MEKQTSVPIKNSIATQLLKLVFGVYLVLVVSLTAVHLVTEYANTKAGVLNELQSLETTVQKVISQALWDMDLSQAQSIMKGIVRLPVIAGIHIDDHKGNLVGKAGRVLGNNGNMMNGIHGADKGGKSARGNLFGHTFDVTYARGDRLFAVGQVTLYSSTGVVLDRIRLGFFLLIINALIQVSVFWVLFLWISRIQLSRPLAELTRAVGDLDLDSLEQSEIRVSTTGRNELRLLEEAFNAMIGKLLAARQKLEALNRELEIHRERLEQRVEERTRLLNASEAELRALFAGITDVVLQIDKQGRYLKVGPTSPELLYRPAEELVGKTLHEVFPSDQADIFLGHIRQSLAGHELVSLEYHLAIDGKTLWFDGRISPMSDDTIVFVARDITERKQIETQLLNAKERAESANRAKSAFLANMSHELRTPLNAIIGFAEFMTRDTSLSSEQQRNLATIVSSGEYLLSLINDVLAFSKIEAGQVPVQLEDFDLYRLLFSLEEMFRLRVRQKGLSLTFERQNDLPRYIRADQNKLRQVLTNLLGNAIKFTVTGGITLRVKSPEPFSSGDGKKCLLEFDVIDTGTGIHRDDQEKIFDAFFQVTHGIPERQGTGLGLPISRRFVQSMGGRLVVESRVDAGTTFSFSIEVETVDGTDVPSPDARRRVMGIRSGEKEVKLMVTEDNENNRNLLVNLLRAVGFEVLEAKNGREAADLWEAHHPHLIFMDLRMPVMNGYDAINRIKSAPGGGETVIIALTANAFEEDRLEVLAHGGDGFVRKPFREFEIFDILSDRLGVKFIYEPEKDGDIYSPGMSIPDMQKALSHLPPPLKEKFGAALDRVDFELALLLLKEIRQHNADLAGALAKPIDGYQFDILQQMMEGSKE